MTKFFFSVLLLSAFFFTGCIKNDPVLVSDSKVEFDAATFNANAAGLTYPVLTRVPIVGASTPTSQPLITRTTTTPFTLRVNLVGAQRASATDFTYIINSSSTAIAGTHYTSLSGTGTIPANSSFGFITINIVNPGVSSPNPVILVLELTSNANFAANFNYAKVGISIAQL
ncbi:MAG: hypothetical protein WKF35_07795 [Ferruginibacter sp.]